MDRGRRFFLAVLGAMAAWRGAAARAARPFPRLRLTSCINTADPARPPAGLVIDYHADPRRGRLYDVFDAHTGEDLSNLRIRYADEARGIIRRYPHPVRIVDGEIVTEELRRDIRIRLKPQWRSEAEGLAYHEAQWRRHWDGG